MFVWLFPWALIGNVALFQTPLALTITNKYVLKGSREERTKHFVEVFNVKEFGINTAFFNDWKRQDHHV